MIKLQIVAKGDKVLTNEQKDDKVTNSEIALMILELERMRKRLLEIEIQHDFELEK